MLRNRTLRRVRNESHISSFWKFAKVLAQELNDPKNRFEVYYPSKDALSAIANAQGEEEVRARLHNHYRFVFSRLEKGGSIYQYPTVLVLQDNPQSSQNDIARYMAGHISVLKEDLIAAVEMMLEDDSDMTLADLFDSIDVRRERKPADDNDSGLEVNGFTLSDNGTVRDVLLDAMLLSTGRDGDYRDVFASLNIASGAIVQFNRNENDDAMSRKLPVYGKDSDGNIVAVKNDMTVEDMRNVVHKQLMTWFNPNNHAQKMWDMAWFAVLEEILLDHWDEDKDDLDFNPYYVESRVRNIHLTKSRLGKIRLESLFRKCGKKRGIRNSGKHENMHNVRYNRRRYEAYSLDRDVIDSLADERVYMRKEKRSMKRLRSRL